MKKQILIIALSITTLFTNAFAEDKTADVFKTFRFGLFAGPTFNSMRPIAANSDLYNVSKSGSNVGFSFGINADYNVNERYTIFSGIGLDWRGGSINTQMPTGSTPLNGYLRGADIKYKVQYLTIPIGLKMTAFTFDKIKIQALTGLDLGLLLSQKGNYTFTLNTVDTSTGKYVTKSMEKQKLGGNATVVPVSVGWSVGAGGEYDLNGKNAVTFHLIYRNGFVDVTTPKNNDDGTKFSDGNIRSNTFALRFGYTF